MFKSGSTWQSLCSFFSLLIFSATPTFAARLVPVDSNEAPGSGLIVNVKDEKDVLRKANVWVESSDGKMLFEDVTAQDGSLEVKITEEDLAKGVHITAWADNHSAVSVLETSGHTVTLELPIYPVDKFAILNGLLTGFEDNEEDNQAQVGLVAKALELSDLAQLDSSAFISPMKDEIVVKGIVDKKVKLPSNVVLPEQTIAYYSLPFTVNKPKYRLPVPYGSKEKYFGLTGTVETAETLDAIQDKDGWRILNYLNIEKVVLSKQVDVPSNGKPIEMDLESNTKVGHSIQLKPGKTATQSKSTKHLVAALWETKSKYFIPTDIKMIETDTTELKLKMMDPKESKLLDIFVNSDTGQYRGSWINGTSNKTNKLSDRGITAELEVDGVDDLWTVKTGSSPKLMIAHLEEKKKTSVGNERYEDRWVLVAPHKAAFKVPAETRKALAGKLGTISHVSVDLMEVGSNGYPFIKGDTVANGLSAIEKIRKKLDQTATRE